MTSLRTKLTIALLATGLSGVIIIALLVQSFATTEFDNYLLEQQQSDLVDDLANFYEIFGSWEAVNAARARLPQPPQEASDPETWAVPKIPLQFVLFDAAGNLVFEEGRTRPGDRPPQENIEDANPDDAILNQPPPPEMQPQYNWKDGNPITIDGETVGYVILIGDIPGRDLLGEAYLARFNQLLLAASAGATVIALVLSVVFARSLSNPLREIAAAIQSVSRGKLDQQVPVRSKDEIGQVAEAFNQMSAQLVRANQLRRQMTADIAHELRTPLMVIVGYLGSLREGLIRPSEERFAIMHEEAVHLQRLIDDLRTLSLADAGELSLNLQDVSATGLLERTIAAFQQQAAQQNVTLTMQPGPNMVLLKADPDRIFQVLSNLVSNALRFTPEGGQITLHTHFTHNHASISVTDTGSGIDAEHLPHIFERFYQADASRHDESSESGLGLAIARSIVEAHGGSISANSTIGEGTTITLQVPIKRTHIR